MKYIDTFESKIGRLTLFSDAEHLTELCINGLHLPDESATENFVENPELPLFKSVRRWLENYFVGRNPQISDLPLLPDGSAFQREIWRMLCEIPYGQVRCYGDLTDEYARKFGMVKMSAQAVGGAVGSNPIPIIIPCHRVIGRGGKLTGYSCGLNIKIALLELEGVNTKCFS